MPDAIIAIGLVILSENVGVRPKHVLSVARVGISLETVPEIIIGVRGHSLFSRHASMQKLVGVRIGKGESVMRAIASLGL